MEIQRSASSKFNQSNHQSLVYTSSFIVINCCYKPTCSFQKNPVLFAPLLFSLLQQQYFCFLGRKRERRFFWLWVVLGEGVGGLSNKTHSTLPSFVPGPSISKIQLSVYTTRIYIISDIYKKNTIVKLSALNKCCRLHFNIINLQMFFRGEKSHI